MKFDRRKALLVGERDFRDAAGDLRLALAMGGLAVVIPIAAGSGIRALAVFGGGVSPLVERLSIVGAFFVVFLPASYSLVLALESFVGERERSTLEVLLSTPLREAEIYAGKVGSVLAIALTLCFGALIVFCLVTYPGLGYFPLGILVSLAISTFCQVAAMVAGAVIVSANARTMRAANVMASFIILPMSVVLQLEAALILVGRGELLWAFAAAMALGAVILLRMGLGGFSREALLAREAGVKQPLRRARRAVGAAFREAPTGLALLRARLVPILAALAGFPVGAGLGYLAGGALPAKFAAPIAAALLAAGGRPDPAGLALTVFLHNLLAIVVAGLLAAVTVGLTGFLITALPGALVGYAAALSSWSLALTGILPNGLIEIPIAAIAGGLAIHIGAATIHMDPDGGWTRRVIGAQAELAKALIWMIPLLAVAALLEAYFTPRL
ncbi:MAG: hypothetical protein NVS9B1_06060 [Candidatus Dormibacteraceae bacterium]